MTLLTSWPLQVEGYMYCNSQNRMRMRIYNCFNDVKLHHHFAPIVTRPLDTPDRKPRIDWSRFHLTDMDPADKAQAAKVPLPQVSSFSESFCTHVATLLPPHRHGPCGQGQADNVQHLHSGHVPHCSVHAHGGVASTLPTWTPWSRSRPTRCTTLLTCCLCIGWALSIWAPNIKSEP